MERDNRREEIKQEKLRKQEEEKQLRQAERDKQKAERDAVKLKERNEKEAARLKEKADRDEKLRKEREEKEAQKREKERKRQEEVDAKNEEKRKKDEEKRKVEEEKLKKEQKSAAIFQKFFVVKKPSEEKRVSDDETSKESTEVGATKFMPFQVKENMRLAPVTRHRLSEEQKLSLEKILESSEVNRDCLYVAEIKKPSYAIKSCASTLPTEEDSDDVMVIGEYIQFKVFVHVVVNQSDFFILKI